MADHNGPGFGAPGDAFGSPGDGFAGIAPPRRPRPSLRRLLGSALVALVVISGLIGAVLLARPALDIEHQRVPEAPEAAETR